MDVLLHNNFEIVPFEYGFEYSLKSPEGSTSVKNYPFDEGFVVNHMVSDAQNFSNKNRIGMMNYIMVDCTMHGRIVVKYGNKHISLTPGSAVIYRPVDTQSFMAVHTERYESITIGIDLNSYRPPSGDAGTESGRTLRRIVDRYGDGPLWPLKLPDESMADLIAI